ncbi:hypothetical protein OKW27_006349 [Paraburkholderia sp. 35.1]
MAGAARVRPLVVRALQRHLLREQLLELDAHPGRMRAVDQRRFVRLRARMMQRAHRVHQRRHAERFEKRARDRRGQQLRQRRARERVVDCLAQIHLRHARGARIDRCQRLRQRRVFIDDAHGRMHHLHAEEAAPHVAAHAQARAGRHLLDLRAVEIQKAQHEFVAVGVAQLHEQLPARAIGDLIVEHHAFGLRDAAGQQVTDRRQRGFVFVAHRQMQHEVDVACEAEFGELVGGFDRGFGGGFCRAFGFGGGFVVARVVGGELIRRVARVAAGLVAVAPEIVASGHHAALCARLRRISLPRLRPRTAAPRFSARFEGGNGRSAVGQRHRLLRKYNIGCCRKEVVPPFARPA